MRVFGKVKSVTTDSYGIDVTTYENGVVYRNSSNPVIRMPDGKKIISYPGEVPIVEFYYNPKSPNDCVFFSGRDVVVFQDLTVEAHPPTSVSKGDDDRVLFTDIHLVSPSRDEVFPNTSKIIDDVYSFVMKGPAYGTEDYIYFTTAGNEDRSVNIVTFNTRKYQITSGAVYDDIDKAFENWVYVMERYYRLDKLKSKSMSGLRFYQLTQAKEDAIDKGDILDDIIKEKILTEPIFTKPDEIKSIVKPTEDMPIDEPDESRDIGYIENPLYDPTDNEPDIDLSELDFPEEKL